MSVTLMSVNPLSTLIIQQPHDAPQAPIDIGGISSPDQSSVSHSKSTPNDTTPLPISYVS